MCPRGLLYPPAVTLTKYLKYEKRLLLRCLHHFISDLINNLGHMRISGNEPSSVILSQTKTFQFLIMSRKNMYPIWTIGKAGIQLSAILVNSAVGVSVVIKVNHFESLVKLYTHFCVPSKTALFRAPPWVEVTLSDSTGTTHVEDCPTACVICARISASHLCY